MNNRRSRQASACKHIINMYSVETTQIIPKQSKPDQVRPSQTKKNQERNPWISLNSFVRIGPFQRVARTIGKKISREQRQGSVISDRTPSGQRPAGSPRALFFLWSCAVNKIVPRPLLLTKKLSAAGRKISGAAACRAVLGRRAICPGPETRSPRLPVSSNFDPRLRAQTPSCEDHAVVKEPEKRSRSWVRTGKGRRGRTRRTGACAPCRHSARAESASDGRGAGSAPGSRA